MTDELMWMNRIKSLDSIKSLQTNLAQNPGFETVNPTSQYQPQYWSSVINTGTATFPYNSPVDIPGRTGKGAAIVAPSGANAYWAQWVLGITTGATYTLTAYANLTNVVGTGAYIEIDWFAGTTFLSVSYSTPMTGTADWTQMTVTGTAPANATSANITLILNGSGTVVFDDVAFTITGGGGGGPTYSCTGNVCTQNASPCTIGTSNCYTDSSCGGTFCAAPPPPPGGGGCTGCTGTCIMGYCIPTLYLYGAVGLGIVLVLSMKG